MPGYKNSNKLLITEKLSKNILSLPLYPGLNKSKQLKVVNEILNFYKK